MVVLRVQLGIVLPGILRDAHDVRGLGHGQLAHLLAEIGLCRGIDAVGPAAEVDNVEIHLQDLFARVVIGEAQRAEDLKHLAADRDLILAGQVFDHLLGQRRGAARAVRAAQHVKHGLRRALPVHAVVLEKAFVLDRHQRLPDIVRDIGKLYQRAVLRAVELFHLHPLAGVLILIIQDRALLECVGRRIHVQLGLQRGVDIGHENTEKDHGGANADGKQRADHLEKRGDPAVSFLLSRLMSAGAVFFHQRYLLYQIGAEQLRSRRIDQSPIHQAIGILRYNSPQ